jgi:hypothetical protein
MPQSGSATAWHGEIRRADVTDAEGVADLAAELAHSFEFRCPFYRARGSLIR